MTSKVSRTAKQCVTCEYWRGRSVEVDTPNLIVFYALANLLVGAFLYKKQERSRTMEALWFVLGFVVTTTVVLATEKLIIKN